MADTAELGTGKVSGRGGTTNGVGDGFKERGAFKVPGSVGPTLDGADAGGGGMCDRDVLEFMEELGFDELRSLS